MVQDTIDINGLLGREEVGPQEQVYPGSRKHTVSRALHRSICVGGPVHGHPGRRSGDLLPSVADDDDPTSSRVAPGERTIALE